MKMGRPIKVQFFPGMDNVTRVQTVQKVMDLPNAENIVSVTPKVILNMDVTQDAKLIARPGQTVFLALEGVHSLISDGENLFCVAKGTSTPESMWRISPTGIKVEISPITGSGYPMSYIKINQKIYMSSKVWHGVYSYATDTVGDWGTVYGDDPSIISDISSSEELLTLNVKSPRFMENLCLYSSRIWGSVNNEVDYSEPYAFDWFKDENRFEFFESIVMIAQVENGLYVASDNTTWFMKGSSPDEMKMDSIGEGSMFGSLQYCNFSKLGDNIPVWTSKTGIVAGLPDGKLKNLTSGKVCFDVQGRAASLFSNKGGVPQYLSSFGLPSVAVFGDTVTAEVLREGKLI